MGTGDTAGEIDLPLVSLPGVVGGDIERVDLGTYVGDRVLVLALYPSNFGPAAGHAATLCRVCDRLADASTVAGFGVAPESVYSHRRFARESDLDLGLISDPTCEIARTLGVVERRAGGIEVPERSLFVFDYRGRCVRRWTADGPDDQPDPAALREQVADLTPSQSARGCYRVAYASHQKGRRYLSRGLQACDDANWTGAGTAFEAACGQFAEAADLFAKGTNLADDPLTSALTERARRRATSFRAAAEWLTGFATAADDGDAGRKRTHREEAARVLERLDDGDPLPDPEAAERLSDAGPVQS